MTWSRKLTKKAHKSAIEACRDGNLEALKVLTGASFDTTNVNTLYYSAAENGHAEVIRWLRNAHITHLQTYILIEILSRAITKTHLNVVQVCVQEEEAGYDEAVHIAIEKGNKIILSWLLSYHINSAIAEAAGIGNLDILRWMTTVFNAKRDVSDNDNEALQCASGNGKLDVVKWLVEKSGQKVDATARNNRALGLAAENGHLDVVKWLVFESRKAVVIADQDNYGLRKAAENGHWAIVKFLAAESQQVYDVTVEDNIIIRQAAETGRLDIVKWLIEECEQEVDPTAVDNSVIKCAAENGHLDVVKWLVSEAHVARQSAFAKYGFKYAGWKVDATAEENRACRIAVKHGHFEIVKWLVKESGQTVDITVNNDEVLRTVIEGDHGRGDGLEMVKWLILESGQAVDIHALPYFTDSSRYRLADGVFEYLTLIKLILEHTTLENIQQYPEMVEQIEKDPEQIEVYVHVNLKDDELQSIAESRYTPAFRRGGGASKFRMLILNE